jgi:hypothetical protein
MGAKVGHLAWARGLLRPVPRALHPDRPPDRGLRQGVGWVFERTVLRLRKWSTAPPT